MIRRRVTSRAHIVELAPRSDGARYRRVSLALEQDGALLLTSHEMGASLEAAWGSMTKRSRWRAGGGVPPPAAPFPS